MKVLDALRARPLERQLLPELYMDPLASQLGFASYSFGGNTYVLPVSTTLPGQKAERVANSFDGYVIGGFMGNSVIFSLVSVRLRVFSEARLQFQRVTNGRPGDLFGTADLSILERPWAGGTTGDLLAVMLLDNDFAGNCYLVRIRDEIVRLRPDWVEILYGDRMFTGSDGLSGAAGKETLGYLYFEGGRRSGERPVAFLPDEVAHFMPNPDPRAEVPLGMSWLTPVIREIKADGAATSHKLAFFENAATPNLAVSLKEVNDPQKFADFVDKMDDTHKGWQNAYKTLYLGAGADVTVIGTDLRQLDFKAVQGAGETRLAAAAGVPPSVAGLSEGLQGSSLNAGNFSAARRQFADTTLSPLWRNAAGSLETLVPAPPPARLWFDARDIPFLREDQKDAAQIRQMEAQAIRELFMAGFTPDSIVKAVAGSDWSLLEHTGTYSIQVQSPGTTSTKLPATEDFPPGSPEGPQVEPGETPAVAAKPAMPALPAGAGGNGRRP